MVKRDVSKVNVGDVFDRLTVIEPASDAIYGEKHRHYKRWLCECSCSKHTRKIILEKSLIYGEAKSCGCKKAEGALKSHLKTNIYDLSGFCGVCYLSNTSNCFYFDIEDYDKIKNYCWREENGYVRTDKKGDSGIITLSRLIMNCPNDKEVDHINRNKYDNRKNNLRIVDRFINNQNKDCNSPSGCSGVSWYKPLSKWKSSITYNGKYIHFGYFDDLEDAIKVRLEFEVNNCSDLYHRRNTKLLIEYGYIN